MTQETPPQAPVDQPTPEQAAVAETSMLEQIPPEYQPVVEKYGFLLFATCFNAGMLMGACNEVSQQAHKHASRRLAQAAAIIAQNAEQIVQALMQVKEWSPELVQECNKAIDAATKHHIVTPPSSGRIILPN